MIHVYDSDKGEIRTSRLRDGTFYAEVVGDYDKCFATRQELMAWLQAMNAIFAGCEDE